MNGNSKTRAGYEIDDSELPSNPSCSVPCGSSSSREEGSSLRSTATSRHVEFTQNFVHDLCIPACHYFRNMAFFQAFQDRLKQAQQILPENSIVDSQSQQQHFSQEMSQAPHVLSNDEFMTLLNSPPPRLFHPVPEQRPAFFSLANSFLPTPPSISLDSPPDSQPPMARTMTVPHSQPEVRSTPQEDSPLQVDKENTPPAAKTASKKRPPAKKPTKKAKKGKSNAADDVDEDGEEPGSVRWIDAEVSQLIAFRNEMDDEFRANAKKQALPSCGFM